MNKFRHWILLATLGLLAACSNHESTATGITRAGKPDMESWQVVINFTDQGKTRAVVKADHLEKYNDRQFIQINGNVIIDFYDENERHSSLLTSGYAEVEESSNFMQAYGQVVVVSDSGVTLVTDTLSLDHESELIFTNNPVMVTTTLKDTLYGIGFESDLKMEQWKILNPSGVTARDAK